MGCNYIYGLIRYSRDFTSICVNWLKSFWKALTVPHSVGRPSSKPANGGHSSDDPHADGGQITTETVRNFTPRAQQVLGLSRQEADRFNHNFVGTEHLLLGLIRLGQGTAVAVLGKMGLNLETVRLEVEKQVGTGPDQKIITYSIHAASPKAPALAAKEAKALNHTYIGTEHILLGLLCEGDGVAARVLKNLDVDIERTRREILKELDPNYQSTAEVMKPPEKPQNAGLSKPPLDSIDTSKRYDVFCAERNQQMVVYRNALFKGRSKLLSTREHDIGAEFLELEQSNGQTVYLSRLTVVKFCEHGGEFTGEIISPK